VPFENIGKALTQRYCVTSERSYGLADELESRRGRNFSVRYDPHNSLDLYILILTPVLFGPDKNVDISNDLMFIHLLDFVECLVNSEVS
jgi:hypothetical protein